MNLASDFNLKSREATLIENKKDVKIAKLKAEVHEVRQRTRDFIDLNTRFVAL